MPKALKATSSFQSEMGITGKKSSCPGILFCEKPLGARALVRVIVLQRCLSSNESYTIVILLSCRVRHPSLAKATSPFLMNPPTQRSNPIARQFIRNIAYQNLRDEQQNSLLNTFSTAISFSQRTSLRDTTPFCGEVLCWRLTDSRRSRQ